MNIEIGKTYLVSAYYKKSMTEIEQFMHKDGRMLNSEILWRNGTFIIRIEDEDERESLQYTLSRQVQDGNKNVEALILNQIGLNRYCCRTHMIGHVQIIDKL